MHVKNAWLWRDDRSCRDMHEQGSIVKDAMPEVSCMVRDAVHSQGCCVY